MARIYELFIDELGQANPVSKQSDIYVLLGCSIEEVTSPGNTEPLA
ncbi:MAG: hypothetical protein U0946_02715 [Patescibacteria group bacterium]|nr:hypothetical protein [Patescibacteria group bacterium]